MPCAAPAIRQLTGSVTNPLFPVARSQFYATLGRLGSTPTGQPQGGHSTSGTHAQTLVGSSSGSATRRQMVTPFNDDGTVPWKDLSVAEKAARSTQQTFNLGLVAVGVVMTGALVYTLFDEVFMPESKTAQFARAVNFIKRDYRCTVVLGPASDIWAHGEPTTNKWQRSRPIASTTEKDKNGVEHLVMQFYVEGSKAMGTVHLHMTRLPKSDDFEYKHLYLDVKGHPRIYVKRDETTQGKRGRFSFLGMKW